MSKHRPKLHLIHADHVVVLVADDPSLPHLIHRRLVLLEILRLRWEDLAGENHRTCSSLGYRKKDKKGSPQYPLSTVRLV